MTTPIVGLVGSRSIDQGLQSCNKKTVTDFTFPAASRTPNQISVPRQGSVGYDGSKSGDCYAEDVEDSHLLKVFLLIVMVAYATLTIV